MIESDSKGAFRCWSHTAAADCALLHLHTMKAEELVHTMLCNFVATNYPQLIFTTDLNGIRLPISLAARIKHLKSGRGIPDLIIFHAAHGFHGLLIEIKADDQSIYTTAGKLKSNQHLQEQAKVVTRLRQEGFAAFFVCGFEAGRDCIMNYMSKLSRRMTLISEQDPQDISASLQWVEVAEAPKMRFKGK